MKSKLLLAAIAGLTLSANTLFAEAEKKTIAEPTTMAGECHMKKGAHGCTGPGGCNGKTLKSEHECTTKGGTWSATAPAAAPNKK